MAFFDPVRRCFTLRLVYDGLGTAGKTTNVRQAHALFTLARSGDVFVPAEERGRTLFFDWLELEAGVVEDHPLRCQVLTVPGQFLYVQRRYELLRSADAVVLVCDSSPSGLERSRYAWRFLRRMMVEGACPDVPVIVQANKQDIPGALRAVELAAELELEPGVPVLEASATNGDGVRATLVYALQAARERLRATFEREGPDAVPITHETPEQVYQHLLRHENDPNGAVLADAVIASFLADEAPESIEGLGLGGVAFPPLDEASEPTLAAPDGEGGQPAEVADNDEHPAETADHAEQLAETVGNAEQLAEALGNDEQLAEAVDHDEQTAEGADNDEQAAEAADNDEQTAEAADNDEQAAEGADNDEQAAEATAQQPAEAVDNAEQTADDDLTPFVATDGEDDEREAAAFEGGERAGALSSDEGVERVGSISSDEGPERAGAILDDEGLDRAATVEIDLAARAAAFESEGVDRAATIEIEVDIEGIERAIVESETEHRSATFGVERAPASRGEDHDRGVATFRGEDVDRLAATLDAQAATSVRGENDGRATALPGGGVVPEGDDRPTVAPAGSRRGRAAAGGDEPERPTVLPGGEGLSRATVTFGGEGNDRPTVVPASLARIQAAAFGSEDHDRPTMVPASLGRGRAATFESEDGTRATPAYGTALLSRLATPPRQADEARAEASPGEGGARPIAAPSGANGNRAPAPDDGAQATDDDLLPLPNPPSGTVWPPALGPTVVRQAILYLPRGTRLPPLRTDDPHEESELHAGRSWTLLTSPSLVFGDEMRARFGLEEMVRARGAATGLLPPSTVFVVRARGPGGPCRLWAIRPEFAPLFDEAAGPPTDEAQRQEICEHLATVAARAIALAARHGVVLKVSPRRVGLSAGLPVYLGLLHGPESLDASFFEGALRWVDRAGDLGLAELFGVWLRRALRHHTTPSDLKVIGFARALKALRPATEAGARLVEMLTDN